jgi:DNA-binding SARP family transcriptional activator
MTTVPGGDAHLRFALLGPLRVERDGQPISLGSPQVGVLATLLALRARQLCTNELIGDVLWGERAPESSAKLLHGLVTRLRRALEPERSRSEEPTVLRTGIGGYVLDIYPDTVDANVFSDGVLAAQEELRQSDYHSARRTLTEAMRLWRGPAVPELSHRPDLFPEIARLEDLRLVGLEALSDARLSLGEHAELVPDLETLVGQNPLRERLWANLVLALARSGRQADALRAYQRVREQLVEELGVEPGAELRRLERAVLDQDASVLDPSAAPAEVEGHATLVVDHGGFHRELPITGQQLTIGSAPGNGLMLSERAVSRVHAVIERMGPGWCVRDLGSTNGTWVNGKLVREVKVLRPGDEIAIGGVSLRLLVDEYPADGTYGVPRGPTLDDEEQQVVDELCRPILAGSMLSSPPSVAVIATAMETTEETIDSVLDRLYEHFELPPADRRLGRLAAEAIRRGALTP